MLPKPEFGDLHRFKVWLGLALIAAVPVVIWFFLKQPFDLLTPDATIDQLSPTARLIVRGRQVAVGVLMVLVLVLSVLAFVVGLKMVRSGLLDWNRVQELHNRSLELEVLKKEIDLQPQTPAQVVQEAQAEVDASTPPISDHGFPQLPSIDLPTYLQMEEEFAAKLRMCVGQEYEVLQKQKAGGHPYDFVLLARRPGDIDCLIQIKLTRGVVNPDENLREAITHAYAANSFSSMTQRPVRLVLLFIVPSYVDPGPMQEMFWPAIQETGRIHQFTVVAYQSEQTFRNLDCRSLRNVLLLSPDPQAEDKTVPPAWYPKRG